MNQTRQQQLLSHIKRTVSTILQQTDHELFHDVVIIHVHLSNDGKICRIFVQAPQKAFQLLTHKYIGTIQNSFRKQYERRNVPRLEFQMDDGSTAELEALLESLPDPNV